MDAADASARSCSESNDDGGNYIIAHVYAHTHNAHNAGDRDCDRELEPSIQVQVQVHVPRARVAFSAAGTNVSVLTNVDAQATYGIVSCARAPNDSDSDGHGDGDGDGVTEESAEADGAIYFPRPPNAPRWCGALFVEKEHVRALARVAHSTAPTTNVACIGEFNAPRELCAWAHNVLEAAHVFKREI